MELIHRNSKTTSHFSLQYLLAAPWQPERLAAVEFEKALLDNGLDFSQTNLHENCFTLTRNQPSHLQIKLEPLGPQVLSIQITSMNPQYDLDMFCRDTEAVVAAFVNTWPSNLYQILTRSGKIHHLYSTETHAFKYLWEQRLGQQPQDFELLGNRPVASGGLRLLMPPHSVDGDDPVSIEIRIESFLREVKKLFVETIFNWTRPVNLSGAEAFSPQKLMYEIENFAANELWNFILHNPNSQQ